MEDSGRSHSHSRRIGGNRSPSPSEQLAKLVCLTTENLTRCDPTELLEGEVTRLGFAVRGVAAQFVS